MARVQQSLSPAKPRDRWSLPWQASAVSCTNYTASPCYIRVGRNQYPTTDDYDVIVPAGAAVTFPCEYASDFAAFLSLPLATGVNFTNLTERVDFVFVQNESLPQVATSQLVVAKQSIRQAAYTLPASATGVFVLDARFTKVLQLSTQPTSGIGRAGVDIEFSNVETGPFAPYIAYRLPAGTDTSKFFYRAIPIYGNFIRVAITNVSPTDAVSGVIYFELTNTFVPNLDERWPQQLILDTTVNPGVSVSIGLPHMSGAIEYIEINLVPALPAQPYSHRYRIYTDIPGVVPTVWTAEFHASSPSSFASAAWYLSRGDGVVIMSPTERRTWIVHSTFPFNVNFYIGMTNTLGPAAHINVVCQGWRNA